MGPRYASGCANFAEFVASGHFLSRLCIDATQMTIHGHEPTTVINDDCAAVEKIIPRIDDGAGCGRDYWRADGGRDIHA
jgi:hypothetical protein